MKKIITFLFITNCCLLSFSQEPPLNIDEQFDNNYLLWEEIDNAEFFTKVENGVYTLKNKKTQGTRFFWKDFNIDESRDFIIEAKIRDLKKGNNRIGLVWNSTSSWKNSNFFNISGNGYYCISKYEEGTFKDILAWKQDEKVVNVSPEYNLLKIHKTKGKVFFYINDYLVYKMKYTPFQGQKYGFYLSSEMEAEVDYFRIFQYGDANINLIANPINGYVKENLGANINGSKSDRAPIISADGKTIYYVRGGYSFISGGENDTDVYMSKLGENGEWQPSVNVRYPINNSSHNGIASVSSDNQTLYIINTYYPDGSSKGPGLSIANKEGQNWGVPKDVKIKNYYNNNIYVNYALSADRNVMVMSIERKDSRGDLDIYISFKEEDGSYSEPENIGDVLNTKYKEGTPFLAADNKTLYFSSDGHPGYGDYDIFVTERLDDTWLNWSKPRNLGPEINSSDWDAYFTVPANGEYAYMVSNDSKISLGETDIIRIKLAESAKPKPIMLVKGKVINGKTNEIITGATIVYEYLETGEEIGEAQSDKENGTYQVALPSEKKYGFQAEKEGFYAVSDFLDLTNLGEYGEITKDLYLQPIEKDEIIRLNNVFFDVNKSDLRPESNGELNRLVDLLNKNKNLKIKIEGHTDNQGNSAYNLKLSESRAEAVVNYLIAKGISSSRLDFEGFGLTKPIASNDTEEGRQANRRVEFRILEN